MKNVKNILSMALIAVMLIGMMAGCGGSKVNYETDAQGGVVQNKTAIVSYNSSGYGDTWLRKCAEEFNKMYAEEGYKIELDISYSNESNAKQEIGKGGEKNDVDLYIGAGGLESLLDASNKTMRGKA